MKITEEEWGALHKIITEIQETYISDTDTRARANDILKAHGFLKLRQRWDIE